MKRIYFFTLALLIVIAALYVYYHPEKIAQLEEAVVQSDIVDSIISFERVIAPPPLRFPGNAVGTLDMTGVISETNARRVAFNKPILVENSLLNQAAQAKLNDMANKQYFEHISPDGRGPSDLADTAGYSYIIIGENLAVGGFADDRELLDAWMASPGHRANILNSKYKEIGVAVGRKEFQGKKVWLAVQEFGKPASECPQLNMELKSELDNDRGALDTEEERIQALRVRLENERPRTSQEIEQYKTSVQRYNALADKYRIDASELKIKIEAYNKSVREYNACIEA